MSGECCVFQVMSCGSLFGEGGSDPSLGWEGCLLLSGFGAVCQALISLCAAVKKARVLDAEGLALGSIIATSKKAKRDFIDDSFNRYVQLWVLEGKQNSFSS